MKCIALTLALACAIQHPAVAAVSDEEFAQLKAEFAALAQRVNALESENAQLRAASQETIQEVELARQEIVAAQDTASDEASWTDRIKIKGDFRYRYQNDDVAILDSERNRQRIRARPAIVAQLPGDVEVGLGMATGSDNPVSANQTLGGGGSSKSINLDLAYFRWSALDGGSVTGGKFKNPLIRAGGNGLVWDSDWRPEGLSAGYEDARFFATALGTWLESDSNRGQEFAYGLQGGIKGELRGTTLKVGAGYYDVDAAGNDCFFDETFCAGNSTNPDGTYRFDFREIEVLAEARVDLANLPVQAYIDYVQNTDADRFDTGWALGVKLGESKRAGGWQAGYTYNDVEADAVLGLLTDSDFAGGGTDAKGHVFRAAYALTDRIKLGLTYFVTERQDSNGIENAGVPYDLDTLHLDLAFKYD